MMKTKTYTMKKTIDTTKTAVFMKEDGSYLFKDCEGVTDLDLRWNNISKIENIPEGVTNLDLSNNNISKIENIPKGVTELYLWNSFSNFMYKLTTFRIISIIPPSLVSLLIPLFYQYIF